jgi:hypothetical protein
VLYIQLLPRHISYFRTKLYAISLNFLKQEFQLVNSSIFPLAASKKSPHYFGESNYTLLKHSHTYQLRAFAFEDRATEEKGGAPGKANNWIKDCSAVFNWACKYGVVPDHFLNPCLGLGKFK